MEKTVTVARAVKRALEGQTVAGWVTSCAVQAATERLVLDVTDAPF